MLQFEETSTLYPKQLYIYNYVCIYIYIYLVFIPNGFQINGLGSLLEYLSRVVSADMIVDHMIIYDFVIHSA